MTGPNLSAWAINHPSLIRYLIGLLLLSGAYAYFTLGQMEDPEFTVVDILGALYAAWFKLQPPDSSSITVHPRESLSS